MGSELAEIKARILEIRDSLSEPLKGFLNKKIKKTEAYFEENKPTSAIDEFYFGQCLNYAEKCKKIEKDFPFRWSDHLTTDNKLFSTFLHKLISVCVLDSPSEDTDKIKDKIYRDVRDILKKLLNSDFHQSYRYETLYSIKKIILELLILLLDKKEGAKFSDEYRVFFTDIIALTKKNADLNHYLDKIDNTENSEYFSPKNLANIRCKFFEIIFLSDSSIIYRNLLAKIEEISKREFGGQPALLNFINCFISELINKKNDFGENSENYPNESFDLGMVLICQSIIYSSEKIFVNRLIKLPAKSTFEGKLSKFKQDYHDKTGKEFPGEVLNKGQFSPGKQVHNLPDEIAGYFSIREINRSSKVVKKAVKIALRRYNKLASSEDQQIQTTPIEKVNKFKGMGGRFFTSVKEGVEKFTDIIDEASNKAMEVFEMGQKMTGSVIDSLKDTVSNLKSKEESILEPSSKLSEEDKKKLHFLRGRFEVMNFKLIEIRLFLKNNIAQDRPSSIIINHDDEIAYLNDEEFADLEVQSKEIESNLNGIYISAISKFKSELENNSWFKNEKFSLKERIKFFFTRGSYGVNLEKLKNMSSLDDKIDFISEKDFFFKVSFFSLLHCGVVRWPWLNKEKFAMQWAEQVILLKIKDYIERTTDGDLSKADLLLEALKIYHQVWPGKKDFLSELYPHINQTYIKYSPELTRLFKRINSRIGVRIEASSSVAPEINSDYNTPFFNARNKEQGPSQGHLIKKEAPLILVSGSCRSRHPASYF